MIPPFFSYKQNVLYCEDVNLQELSDTHGTPLYVYSKASIEQQMEKLKSAMSKHLPADRQPMFCYACKANSNLAVLTLLRQAGSSLEIVSEGELRRGLAAGFKGEQIVATGVGKTASEIKALLEANVHQINVESIPELYHIQEIAEGLNVKAPIVFRFNPDISGGGHDKISTGRAHDKFGLTYTELLKAFEISKGLPHINALGLSMHIGSQVFEVQTFRTAFQKLPDLVAELRVAGHTIERLDIGGGFPIQYLDEDLLDLEAYAQWVNEIIVPLDADIIMEPGRFLVGNAGAMLSEVTYVKQGDNRSFLVIDAAMNDLIRPSLYDAYHHIIPMQDKSRAEALYDVVGPICESGDTFSQDRKLPELRAKERVAILSAGAYGFCMASNYNTRPMAAEVLIDGDQAHVIRKRQTVEELLERDILI